MSSWSLRVFVRQFSIKIVKYEDGMLILGQNDIFCDQNVVNYSVCFLQLTVFKYVVASHVTEPRPLLTEAGTVIKFSYISSHRGTCMLQIYNPSLKSPTTPLFVQKHNPTNEKQSIKLPHH